MDKVFSYTNQPQNVEAWRFGEACSAAAKDPKCGDPIDRGLILLRELEAKGYGIVKLASNAQVKAAGVASPVSETNVP